MSKSAELEITYRSPSDLIPYASNAKVHEDAQVQQIAGSIKQFGFNNPILLDGDLGVIAGHGRLAAAQKLGMDTVPTIDLSHLTEPEKKAYILADNRLGEVNTSWDFDLVSAELEALELEGLDIELTGFDDSFIIKPDDEGLTDEDAAPEVPDNPVSVQGDVWIMGEHRLMCGDSMNNDHVTHLMQGKIADMVYTDPPYGMKYNGVRMVSGVFESIANDDVVLDIAPIIEVHSTGWIFCWTTWKVLDKWIRNMEGLGYPSNMVIWAKGGGGIGNTKSTFIDDYEIALVWHRNAELKGKRIGSVWSIKKDSIASYVHPTQKPVELATEAMDKTTGKGAVVLDLFSGSGSTLIACQKIHRIARVMELDEGYSDVAVKRWQDYTGEKAILESTGQTFDEVGGERVQDAA